MLLRLGEYASRGYVDDIIKNGEKEYKKVKSKVDSKKGFELMNLEMPKVYNTSKEEVNTIKDIWFGKEINLVREKIIFERFLEDVEI